MVITFAVDGEPVVYYRNWFTGRAELRLCGRVELLESALNPSTQFSMKTTRTSTHRVGGHEIAIRKTRPLLFGGLRPHAYEISVDGVVVAQAHGY